MTYFAWTDPKRTLEEATTARTHAANQTLDTAIMLQLMMIRSGETLLGSINQLTKALPPGVLTGELALALGRIENGDPVAQTLQTIPNRIKGGNISEYIQKLQDAYITGVPATQSLELHLGRIQDQAENITGQTLEEKSGILALTTSIPGLVIVIVLLFAPLTLLVTQAMEALS